MEKLLSKASGRAASSRDATATGSFWLFETGRRGDGTVPSSTQETNAAGQQQKQIRLHYAGIGSPYGWRAGRLARAENAGKGYGSHNRSWYTNQFTPTCFRQPILRLIQSPA
jgi:hypothetical protein